MPEIVVVGQGGEYGTTLAGECEEFGIDARITGSRKAWSKDTMVYWVKCGVKLGTNFFPSKEQRKLRWAGHVEQTVFSTSLEMVFSLNK